MVKYDQKYIFVLGGVLSGVGKGITAASIGAVLQAKGLKVSIQKCDPYLNVDAGLLNPAEHGECFVTRDGAETDLDLGHYERFLDIELTQENATLSGKLLQELIEKERNGGFNGKTVQLVPHLTQAIQSKIIKAAKDSDVHIVEIGGTVGDYEGLSYIEAIRELALKKGRENCLFIHVVYLPFIETSKEFKTKPAQNALNDLRGFGIVPDGVIVRSDKIAPNKVRDKIALFGGVNIDNIQLMPNVDTVYTIPKIISKNGIYNLLSNFTKNQEKPNLTKWDKLLKNQSAKTNITLEIGLVAKYLDNVDTYISVIEALKAASWEKNISLKIKWINAETVSKNDLKNIDGIVVPGGFGPRGIEGKIFTADYCLKNNIPYLGICLGLQVAVIAALRNEGITDANSTEFDPNTKNKVIYIMENQVGKESTGGTLRLGNYKAKLTPGSKVEKLYQQAMITERHRHRYEVNLKYKEQLENAGIQITGVSPDNKLVEFIEARNHPFFVATQAHPEFKSRPFKPHPLFLGLIVAASKKNKDK